MDQERELDNQKDADAETPVENDGIPIEQDGYRRVLFGQIADGLIPPHPGPPEATDDELSAAAMSDVDADAAGSEAEAPQRQPTIWRVVFLIILMAVALAIVFWK